MKIMILVVLMILVCMGNCDCPIAQYPRRTTLGNIKSQIDSFSSQIKPALTYSYPLVQPLQYEGPHRAMVAINGLGTTTIPKNFGFDIKIRFPDTLTYYIEFQVTLLGIQVDYYRNSRSVWKILQFTFMCTQSPQLILGNLPLYDVIPTDLPNTLKVSTDIAVMHQSVNYQQAIAHVFLSGIEYEEIEEKPSNNENIQKTIQKIEQLKNYAWNVVLINKFTKILKDQQNPGLSLKNPTFTVGNINGGHNRGNIQGINSKEKDFSQIGTINFDISMTTRLKIGYLSYSYLVYLKKPHQDNFYGHISGFFSGQNGQTEYFIPLKNEGMTLIGINGFNFATKEQNTQNLFDFEMKIGKSTKIQNQYFYLIKISPSNQTSFGVGYFGIQAMQGQQCADCPYSPFIFDRFCISKCPSGYVLQINQYGTRYCQLCDLSKFLIPDSQGKQCICANQYYLVVPTRECQRCPSDCLTCNGNKCLTCDTQPPATYRTLNPSTYRCQCPKMVGLNQVGFYDDTENYFHQCKRCNYRCLSCSGGQINQCLSCSAKKNRRLLNGFCACMPNFIQKQINQGYSECLCLPPFRLNSRGQCIIHQNYCPIGQIFVNNMCLCSPGTIRNPVTNLCLTPCSANEYFNQITNQCQCRQGSMLNPSTQKCQFCTMFPNRIYSSSQKKCVCRPGFSEDIDKKCIKCPVNSFYDPRSNSCRCIYNFYLQKSTNNCVKCRSNWEDQSCNISETHYSYF